jgi:hypothetical protein
VSVDSLCDHRAVVYRATTAQGRAGDIIESWAPLDAPAGLNARANLVWLAGHLENPGPGEVQAKRRQWFLLPSFDVRERDILRIVSGPEAPSVLRVLAVNRTTAGPVFHHFEVEVDPSTVELDG